LDWPYGKYGVVLATEEHTPAKIIRTAQRAETAGLGFAFVSDHFHPWNSQQGHSSNIWPLLGALAMQTRTIGLVSAVTCPLFRIHPTALAQSGCTVHHLSEGRFVLGLGTGEFLNEVVVGQSWPDYQERLERLEEVVSLLRALLNGEEVTRRGEFYSVERATLHDSVPDLPIFFAASGCRTAASAGNYADGLICMGAREELARLFDGTSVCGRPKVTQLSVCWAEEHDEAVRTAHRVFPEVALPGVLFSKLGTPREYEEVARQVTPADVEASIVCGAEVEPYLSEIRGCFEAGFDAVALHQIGPDQSGFLEFWETSLRPALDGEGPGRS
jgi:G6PDH family F420-dependent oxidoreductase